MLGGRDFDRLIVNEIVRPWLAANFDLPDNFARDKKLSTSLARRDAGGGKSQNRPDDEGRGLNRCHR